MNESIRTLIFVTVGAVVALGAYITKPRLDTKVNSGVGGEVGEQLFPDFKDSLAASSLEIKQFDESLSKPVPFIVTQQASGIWSLPSHGNYPADAESQLKAVAKTFSDLKIIGVVPTKDNTEHELYGLVDPDKAEKGAKGVGTLIAMQDSKGNDLLRMIVGKEVAGATNQRFVRKQSQDQVYVISIDMSKLPTEFEKWIEKDLLKLSSFDVSHVTLKDYLVLLTQSGALLEQRMEADLSYKSGDKNEWNLNDLFVFRGRDRVPQQLQAMEELNKIKLDELRNALVDLKIVDVQRKPEGLGNSLRISSDKLTKDQARDLQQLGFYLKPTPDGKVDILGANGEVIVDTKDGVEYVLRFGEIKPQSATATAKKSSGDKSAEDEIKVNRFLFVTAQLAASVLTPPQLDPEPAGPEPAKEDKPAASDKKDDAKADDQKTDEQKAAIVDPQQAERERIKKENQRKMDAYRDQKKKAEVRVAELNSRFADWYYVVSDDVFKKIHLTRSDIVKEAITAKDEGFGIDAFRKLEDDGLKAKP